MTDTWHLKLTTIEHMTSYYKLTPLSHFELFWARFKKLSEEFEGLCYSKSKKNWFIQLFDLKQKGKKEINRRKTNINNGLVQKGYVDWKSTLKNV